MADYTAKDVADAAPDDRRRHARLQEGPRGDRRRHRAGRAAPPRAGPGRRGQAVRPRGLGGRRGRRALRRRRRRGRAALRDRLRGEVGRVRRVGRRAGRAWSRPRARTPSSELDDEIEQLRSTLKENISVGRVRRFVAERGQVVDTYLHQQAGRGVNAVAVVLEGGTDELAHDIAVHIAFAKPAYLSRDEVPADEVATERATLETISRNEGKPEAALEKIVDGRMNGWFKERVLLDQSYVRDEKQTIAGMLGSATHRGRSPRSSSAPDALRHVGESRRIVLKMSGEALASAASDETIDAATVERMAKEMAQAMDAGGLELAVVVGGGNIWRGHDRREQRHGPGHVGLHGHARHGHQRPRPPGRARAAGPADQGADGPLHGRGGRALHPPAGHPAPREGPHRDLRRRHGQPVLHDGHARCAAGGRDRRRAALQGHPFGGRRRLQRRPQARPRRHPLRRDLLHGGDQPRPAGHGPDRHHLLQGQRSARSGSSTS